MKETYILAPSLPLKKKKALRPLNSGIHTLFQFFLFFSSKILVAQMFPFQIDVFLPPTQIGRDYHPLWKSFSQVEDEYTPTFSPVSL